MENTGNYSPIDFEFIIDRRPVSIQAKKTKNLREWKDFVRAKAIKTWQNRSPIKDTNLQLTLIYICADSPPDIDNIIKPIQDALINLIYEDDKLVSDVDSHRRFISDKIDINNLPFILQHGILSCQECVYVKISQSQDLEKYL